MNCKVKKLLALLTAAALLGSLAGCSKNDKKPNQTLKSDPLYEEIEEYINFPELSSIKVSRAEAQKTLDERIDQILTDQSKEIYTVIDEASVEGDCVNVSYDVKSYDEGVTISEASLAGMKEDKADVVIGSNVLPTACYNEKGEIVTEGFETQLIGMKAGDYKEVTITFPSNYRQEELQGLRVSFDVTVHSVSRLTVDEKCSSVSIGCVYEQPEDDPIDYKTFKSLFVNNIFKIDYTTEPNDAVFGTIFKIADYRDLFIGMHKYERMEYTLTIPEDVNERYADYAGKDIKVTFVMEAAITRPEWNDALVKSYTNGQYTTVADYEAAQLESIMASTAYSAVKAAVTFRSYPADLIQELYIDYLRSLVKTKTEQDTTDMTEEQMRELVDNEEDFESYQKSSLLEAEEAVKERLAQEYIIDYLGITLTEEEYEAEREAGYQSYLKNYWYYYQHYYNITFKNAEEMEAFYGKTNLEIRFKENKLLKVILDKVTVVD